MDANCVHCKPQRDNKTFTIFHCLIGKLSSIKPMAKQSEAVLEEQLID
jgi:hypothetical protein